jgi:hypothetical protein
MAELLNTSIKVVLKIKGLLDTHKKNKKECRKIYESVENLRINLEKLHQAPIMEHPIVEAAMKSLNDSLKSTESEVTKCLGSCRPMT